MPENSAVMQTAMLLRLSLIWRSARIVGATFSVVWAKSQKVTTAGDNADDQGAISASRWCRNRRRHYFARYAHAAITRVWVPVDSVGSMTGAKNSE